MNICRLFIFLLKYVKYLIVFVNKYSINTYFIFQAIRSMSQLMPVNEEDMLKIDGVTKANFEKFGLPLLEISQQAAAEKLGIKQLLIIDIRLIIIYIYFYIVYLNNILTTDIYFNA